MFRGFLCLIIMLSITPSFADSNFSSKLKMNQPKNVLSTLPSSQRQNRFYPGNCPRCHYNNPYLSQNDLNALEKYALNKTYRRENDLQRLERLENLAFGATQSGNIYNRYKNVENAILSRPKYGTKTSFLNNLANYFSGQATGFTPNFTPKFTPSYPGYANLGGFNSYPSSDFLNNNFEQYSNGIFGGGWGISGHDHGIGSSIRILD